MAISFKNPLFAEDKEMETNWGVKVNMVVLDETLIIPSSHHYYRNVESGCILLSAIEKRA